MSVKDFIDTLIGLLGFFQQFLPARFKRKRDSLRLRKAASIVSLLCIFGWMVNGLFVLYRKSHQPNTAQRLTQQRQNEIEYLKSELSRIAPIEVQNAIRKSIRAAMQAELETYRALPQVRLQLLEKHFVVNGPAYCTILRLVHASHLEAKFLINSKNRLHSIGPATIKGGVVKVVTRESWWLHWKTGSSGLTKRSALLPATKNTYILHYDQTQRRWKVFENYYDGALKSKINKNTA